MGHDGAVVAVVVDEQDFVLRMSAGAALPPDQFVGRDLAALTCALARAGLPAEPGEIPLVGARGRVCGRLLLYSPAGGT